MDDIRGRFPEKRVMDHIKIGLLIVKLLVVQGFRAAKADFGSWKELRLNSERNYEEEREYQRIKSDMLKAIPSFTILNVPLGGPLFFIYLQVLPNFTPTWILTERIYRAMLRQEEENKISAFHYFRRRHSTEDHRLLSVAIAKEYSTISGSSSLLANEELRMVGSLLSGVYRDGTYWITHYSPLRTTGIRLGYFLLPALSRLSLRLQIQGLVRSYPFFAAEYKKVEGFESKLRFVLKKEL